ncbi:MAG: recombination protein O N-terminal domain-containing protein, partial [Limnochordia bacterium]|nr:recombination protein O N-terminal domain-containing protein [Limnochordia bacterium]
MALYRTDGIVLRTWDLGEADRVAVILTEEEGKIPA